MPRRLYASTINLVSTSSFLIFLYLTLLVATLFWRGRDLSSPWLFLLRSFFPNWRFYHRPGLQPRLFVRARQTDGTWTPWTMYLPRAPFRASDLLHNARNNLQHANQNLIEHLHTDIQALPQDIDPRTLVTYRLTERLAHQRAMEMMGCARFPEFQFELRLVTPLISPRQETAVLTSPAIPAAAHDA